jgi:hypothetical protein
MASKKNNQTSIANSPVILTLGLLYTLSAAVIALSGGLGFTVQSAFVQAQNQPFYFSIDHAGLLYVQLPLVFLTALYFWLAPGLMLTLTLSNPRRVTTLLAHAFLASFAVQAAATTLGKLLGPLPLERSVFLAVSFTLGLAAWLGLWIAGRRKQLLLSLSVPNKRRAIVITLMPVVALITLLPFIFWQDFNPDGLEACTVADSLSWHYLPQLPTDAGFISIGTGLIAQAFLYHPFVMMFGAIEAGVRLPLLLLLPVLFSLLVELIEWKSRMPLQWPHELLLVAGLAVFVVAMSFNASYDPYFADISSPTVQEAMTALAMVGILFALTANSSAALIGFSVLAVFSRPTGLLFMLMLLPAVVLTMPGYRKKWLLRLAVAIMVSMGLIALYQAVYLPWAFPAELAASSGDGALSRLRYLTLFDVKRAAFLIFPAGIAPALALLFFPRQDALARLVTLLTVAYFTFFYLLAFVAMHHFTPAMLLPLIVFWRLFLGLPESRQKIVYAAAAAMAVLAFGVSLPNHFTVNRTASTIGARIAFLSDDSDQELTRHMAQADLLNEVARYEWWVQDPAREYIGSPLALVYYADRTGPVTANHNYIILPDTALPPPDTEKIKTQAGATLYVRNLDTLYRDRYHDFEVNYMSPLYFIPRSTLFEYWGAPQKNYDVDIKQINSVTMRFLRER